MNHPPTIPLRTDPPRDALTPWAQSQYLVGYFERLALDLAACIRRASLVSSWVCFLQNLGLTLQTLSCLF